MEYPIVRPMTNKLTFFNVWLRLIDAVKPDFIVNWGCILELLCIIINIELSMLFKPQGHKRPQWEGRETAKSRRVQRKEKESPVRKVHKEPGVQQLF